MWYVLINLVREFPLATAHSTFSQRLVCVIVMFVLVPFFALPTSILQYSILGSSNDADEIHGGDSDELAKIDTRRCQGTPSSSDEGSSNAVLAFDSKNDGENMWISTQPLPQWLQFKFENLKHVV